VKKYPQVLPPQCGPSYKSGAPELYMQAPHNGKVQYYNIPQVIKPDDEKKSDSDSKESTPYRDRKRRRNRSKRRRRRLLDQASSSNRSLSESSNEFSRKTNEEKLRQSEKSL